MSAKSNKVFCRLITDEPHGSFNFITPSSCPSCVKQPCEACKSVLLLHVLYSGMAASSTLDAKQE